jgi:hypothetical protein
VVVFSFEVIYRGTTTRRVKTVLAVCARVVLRTDSLFYLLSFAFWLTNSFRYFSYSFFYFRITLS